MKESEDDIEDLFRERFSEDEAPISPRVWNSIQSTLPKEASPVGFWNTKNKFLGGFLLVLMAAAGGWFYVETQIKNDQKTFGMDQLSMKENTAGQKVSPNKNNNHKTNAEGENERFTKDFSSDTENRNTNAPNASLKEKGFRAGDKRAALQDQGKKGPSSDKDSKKTSLSENSRSTSVVQSSTIVVSGKKKNTPHQQQSKTDQQVLDPSRIEANRKGKQNSKDQKTGGKTLERRPSQMTKTSDVPEENASDLSKDRATEKNDPENNIDDHSHSDTKEKETKDDLSELVSEANKKQEQRKQTEERDFIKQLPVAKFPETKTENPSSQQLSSTDSSLAWSKGKEHKDRIHDHHLPLQEKKDTMKTKEESPEVLEKATVALSADSITPLPDSLAKSVDSISTADTTGKKEVPKEKSVKISRWTVDLLLSPMLTGSSTKAATSSSETMVEAKNSQDKNQFGFSGGANVNYALFPKLYITTGIFYSSYSEKYDFSHTVRRDSMVFSEYQEVDTIMVDSNGIQVIDSIIQVMKKDTNTISTDQEYSEKKKDQYSFMSVPVSISWVVLKRNKFSLSATAGLRVNLMMKSTTYVSNESSTALVQYHSGISKVTLSYMAALSMEYQLKGKLSLLVQPAMNYHAQSVYSKSSSIRQKPYSIGLNAGVRIRF